MKVILDASVVIDFLRRKDKEKSLYLKIFKRGEKFILSVVTVAEIYSGESAQEKGKQREDLEKIISGVEILIPDLGLAKRVGKIRAKHRLELGDAFIAALALELKFPIATLDRKDFEKIKGLKFYS